MLKIWPMSGVPYLHIAVEGCVGVGKTTLATKIAEFRKTTLLLEEFEKNPFLSDFYKDPIKNVFETEMHFLLLHYHQLKELRNASKEIITDFTFEKDQIFAELNFREKSERKVFDGLYEFLKERLPQPDLILYLKGSEDLIIGRIRNRARKIEQVIDEDYFRNLKRAYDRVFLNRGDHIHVVDADHFDCLNNPAALENISLLIDSIAAHAPCR
jgi:deoxyguanosine kinase